MLKLYHGSRDEVYIPNSEEIIHDWFYLTEDKNIACERAVLGTFKDGQVIECDLQVDGLKILYMDNEPITMWLSVLIQRGKNTYEDNVQTNIKAYMLKHGTSMAKYDVIIGKAADDAFIPLVIEFFTGHISLESVQRYVESSNLFDSVYIKTDRGPNALQLIEQHRAYADDYLTEAQNRMKYIRTAFKDMTRKTVGRTYKKLMLDINY